MRLGNTNRDSRSIKRRKFNTGSIKRYKLSRGSKPFKRKGVAWDTKIVSRQNEEDTYRQIEDNMPAGGGSPTPAPPVPDDVSKYVWNEPQHGRSLFSDNDVLRPGFWSPLGADPIAFYNKVTNRDNLANYSAPGGMYPVNLPAYLLNKSVDPSGMAAAVAGALDPASIRLSTQEFNRIAATTGRNAYSFFDAVSDISSMVAIMSGLGILEEFAALSSFNDLFQYARGVFTARSATSVIKNARKLGAEGKAFLEAMSPAKGLYRVRSIPFAPVKNPRPRIQLYDDILDAAVGEESNVRLFRAGAREPQYSELEPYFYEFDTSRRPLPVRGSRKS
jgi:hypothetical protein